MNETEAKLLGLILSEWARLTLMSPVQQPGEGWLDFRHRIEPLADLETLGVRVDPAWLGSSPAGRQARSRALVSLERSGWIVRTARHRSFRPSHVLPSDLAIQVILDATSSTAADSEALVPPLTTPQTSDVGLSLADLDRMLAIDPAFDRLITADNAALDRLMAEMQSADARTWAELGALQ